MSQTKTWVIAEQQKARHLAYQNNNPEPTEQELIQIELYNAKAKELKNILGFNPLPSEIDMHLLFDKIDKRIEEINDLIDPDDFNDDNADQEIALPSDFSGYQ